MVKIFYLNISPPSHQDTKNNVNFSLRFCWLNRIIINPWCLGVFVVKKALDMQIKNNGKNNPIYSVILFKFFGSGSSGLDLIIQPSVSS